jgi:hypothetical protein
MGIYEFNELTAEFSENSNDAVFGATVQTITPASGVVIVSALGRGVISVSALTGATVTVGRVDSMAATVQPSEAHMKFTVAANTLDTRTTDWPFYAISTSGGNVKVAVF